MDQTSQWICGQAICKYVYPLLTFNFALSNSVMDLICIRTSAVEAGHWWQWWSNKRSMHECIIVYCTADTVHVQAIFLQWRPHWWNQKDLSCVLHEWHTVVCTCPHVVKFREEGVCVCELIYFLFSLYVVYLCYSLTQLWLYTVSEQNKRNHAKVKCHQVTGSRSYIAHLQACVSDGCVTLFISNIQCLLCQQKGMCNFNRRKKQEGRKTRSRSARWRTWSTSLRCWCSGNLQQLPY
jgi:hypothetical protein